MVAVLTPEALLVVIHVEVGNNLVRKGHCNFWSSEI